MPSLFIRDIDWTVCSSQTVLWFMCWTRNWMWYKFIERGMLWTYKQYFEAIGAASVESCKTRWTRRRHRESSRQSMFQAIRPRVCDETLVARTWHDHWRRHCKFALHTWGLRPETSRKKVVASATKTRKIQPRSVKDSSEQKLMKETRGKLKATSTNVERDY